MIIGIGNDLVDIRRIERIITRFGARFTARCFTDTEIATCEKRRGGGGHVRAYAKRFAAKEACAKALGTGFSGGIGLRDIGVVNDRKGRPALELKGAALEHLHDMANGTKPSLHLTLTDEPPLAQAVVVIEI